MSDFSFLSPCVLASVATLSAFLRLGSDNCPVRAARDARSAVQTLFSCSLLCVCIAAMFSPSPGYKLELNTLIPAIVFFLPAVISYSELSELQLGLVKGP